MTDAVDNTTDLATQLAGLLREREQAQTALLAAHTESLGKISLSVALIEERTKGLPALVEHVTALENWRWKMIGIAVGAAGFGGVLGWAVSLVFKH